jgi:RNA polymerase sigma-70 factor, ECF subfamily
MGNAARQGTFRPPPPLLARTGELVAPTPESKQEKDLRFEREALPWMDDVYRFARSMTHDEADADDLVQETYLRAYRSWDTFEPGSDCRRWLFTICRNVFLRTREREARKVDTGGDDTVLETLAALREASPFATATATADSIFSRIDLGPAIRKAIDQLPEVFRSAVVLVDVEGQSYDEAASVLGVPIGTVRSRLFRGRRILQHALLTFGQDAGLAAS